MKYIQRNESFFARWFFGGAFVLGGGVHWLIIFGFLHETTPLLITVYFHSLAVLGIVTGVGIIMRKNSAYWLACCIAITQIMAHTYMLWLDTYEAYGSGVSSFERIADIIFSVLFLAYCVYLFGYVKYFRLRRVGA